MILKVPGKLLCLLLNQSEWSGFHRLLHPALRKTPLETYFLKAMEGHLSLDNQSV